MMDNDVQSSIPTTVTQVPLEQPTQKSNTELSTTGDIQRLLDENVQNERTNKTNEEDVQDETDEEKLNAEKKILAAVTIEAVEDYIDPPPLLKSPYKRMNYEWRHSKSAKTYFLSVICCLINSMNESILEIRLPILSIAKLIVGLIHVYDCPANPRIPEYLIVSGSIGVLIPFILFIYKILPKVTQDAIQSYRHVWFWMKTPLYIFLYVIWIAGCIWVYSIYEPEFVDTQADNYCFRGMYLFIFWLMNISFIILFMFIITVAVMALVVYKKNEKRRQEASNSS